MDRIIRNGSRYMAWVAGALVFLGAIGICADIFSRVVLNSSIKGMVELNAYGLAIACAWSFGFTLLEKAHVRVDVVHSRFGPRMRGFLDIFALLVMTIIAGALAYYGYTVFFTSYDMNSTVVFSRTIMLWWFQFAWFIGLLAFFIVSLSLFLQAARAFLRNDLAGVAAMAGVPNTDDEVRQEIEGALERSQVAPVAKKDQQA